MNEGTVPIYKYNCIDKLNTFIDEFHPLLTKKYNIKIFLVGYDDDTQYNNMGEILDKLAFYDLKKNKNYFIQGSNYGFFNNIEDINNEYIDIFTEIMFMTIDFEIFLKKIYISDMDDIEFIAIHLKNIKNHTNNIIIQMCYSIIWNVEYRNLVLTELGNYEDTFFSSLKHILNLLNIDIYTSQNEFYNKIKLSIKAANEDSETKNKYDSIYEFIKEVLEEEFELEYNEVDFRKYIVKFLKSFNTLMDISIKSNLFRIKGFELFNNDDLNELEYIKFKFVGEKFVFHNLDLLQNFSTKFCRELKKKKLLHQFLSQISDNIKDSIIFVNSELVYVLKQVLSIYYKNIAIVDYVDIKSLPEIFKKNQLKTDDFLKFIKINHCNICYQPTDKKCPLCKITFYCSKECQKKDYKTHKKECKSCK